MTATLIMIGSFAADGAEALSAYMSGIAPLLKAAGAVPKDKFGGGETVVGSGFPQVVAMTEFPSADAIRSMLGSDAYKLLIPLRDKAFSSVHAAIFPAG